MKRKHDKRMAHQMNVGTVDGLLAFTMRHDKGAEMMFIFDSGDVENARGMAATIEKWADKQPGQKLAGLPDADKRVICEQVIANCETPNQRINAVIVLNEEGLLPSKEAP